MTPTDQPTPDLDAVKARVRGALKCDRQYVRCWHGDHEVQLADLRALLAALDAVTAEHRTLKLALVEALGPCAPEHDGTDALEAVQRIVAERDALREELDTERLVSASRHATLYRISGHAVVQDKAVPRGEIWWRDERGNYLGKLVGIESPLAARATPHLREK